MPTCQDSIPIPTSSLKFLQIRLIKFISLPCRSLEIRIYYQLSSKNPQKNTIKNLQQCNHSLRLHYLLLPSCFQSWQPSRLACASTPNKSYTRMTGPQWLLWWEELHLLDLHRRMAELKQIMCWAISINTFVAAGLGGVNTSKLDPLTGARVFLRVFSFSLNVEIKTKTQIRLSGLKEFLSASAWLS